MSKSTGPQAPTSESEAKYAKNLLATFQYWSVYLHPNQYFLGRVYIWCHRPDAIDLFFDLTSEEWEELRTVTQLTQNVLRSAFNPDLFNQDSLGNETGRCHLHVVPRYQESRTIAGFDGIVFADGLYGKNWGRYDKEEDPIKDRPDVYSYLRDFLRQQFIAAIK